MKLLQHIVRKQRYFQLPKTELTQNLWSATLQQVQRKPDTTWPSYFYTFTIPHMPTFACPYMLHPTSVSVQLLALFFISFLYCFIFLGGGAGGISKVVYNLH
ncbi:Hypothetical predicted protein [Podarcis lilfordi]|uniref:Uncharacterized protein n=1 Tax=Podarcis lilfordi TaxID=74358 RepID=A0AA35KLB1_9SAUR|nr:Hypothetical predicted protein [Podarcis lilfordi]